MKVRRGFVTNSSSSSFVIARKKNATDEEIFCDIEKRRDFIKNYLSGSSIEYTSFGYSEVKELVRQGKIDEAVDETIRYLVDCLKLRPDRSLELGEWLVISAYMSDYNCDTFFEEFMYSSTNFEEWENIKVGGETDC